MKQALKKALAKGETKDVLAELLKITAGSTNLHHDIVQLSARFTDYEKKKLANLEEPSLLSVELNRIINATLALIEELPTEELPMPNVINNWNVEDIIKIERKSLEIILDGEFDTFDKERFVAVISAFLGIPKSSVRVLQVYQGSIAIRVELPTKEAEKLIVIFEESGERLSSLEAYLSEGLGGTRILKISVQKTEEVSSEKNQLGDSIKKSSISSIYSWVKIAASIAAIIAFLGAIAEFSGYSLRDFFSKRDSTFINVTVMVEDKNGEFVMRQQGKIVMMVEGGDVKQEDIDSKGSASFKNVKSGDKVRLKVDFSEPYRPLNPDSLYIIPKDGRINLRVGLQHLGKVFGRVLYRDKELAEVIVSVGSLRDTTDDLGRYEILIPETEQRQEQEVFFKANGFKSMMKMAFPQTNQPLNVVMEK